MELRDFTDLVLRFIERQGDVGFSEAASRMKADIDATGLSAGSPNAAELRKRKDADDAKINAAAAVAAKAKGPSGPRLPAGPYTFVISKDPDYPGPSKYYFDPDGGKFSQEGGGKGTVLPTYAAVPPEKVVSLKAKLVADGFKVNETGSGTFNVEGHDIVALANYQPALQTLQITVVSHGMLEPISSIEDRIRKALA
jgi:hypothetical protein